MTQPDDLDPFDDLICEDDSPSCTFDVEETAGECWSQHPVEAVLCSYHRDRERGCHTCWTQHNTIVWVKVHSLSDLLG